MKITELTTEEMVILGQALGLYIQRCKELQDLAANMKDIIYQSDKITEHKKPE